jgi:ribonuclease T2
MIPMRRRVVEMKVVFAIGLSFFLLSGSALARRKTSAAQAGNFAYYLLTLSWAPDYCALPNVDKDPRECGAGKNIGFVVHGLWPQAAQGKGPENCGPASPVSQDIVQLMLNYIPTPGLIQHEWSAHGTCSGLSAADYFANVRKARDSINIPPDFKAPSQPMNLSPAQIDARFATANPSVPKAAFRSSCTNGALQEARICFTHGAVTAAQACPASLTECTSKSILIRPVR